MRFSVFGLMSVMIVLVMAFGIAACADEAEYQRQRDHAIQERDVATKTAVGADAALKQAQAAIAELEATKSAMQSEDVDRAIAFDEKVARLQVQINALEAGSSERTKAEILAVELLRLSSSQREKADSAAAAIDQQIAKAKAAAEAASAAVAEARDRAAAIEDRVARADKEARGNDDASAASIGGLVGTLVPGAATVAPFLIASIYKLLRTNRAVGILKAEKNNLTTAATRIVQSIEVLAQVSPAVRDAIDKHADVIDTIQQPIGKALVDQVQNAKSAPWPLIATGPAIATGAEG
jgi:hypothetical protein